MSTLNTTNIKHASSSSNNIVIAADGSTTISGNATISGNVTCSGTATGFGGGKVLKIENFIYKDISSAQSSSNAYMATGLVCSITPSAANSKIYVVYNLIIGMADGFRTGAAVYRDINSGGFSQLSTIRANASGSNQRLSSIGNGATLWTPQTLSNCFIDTPSYSVGNAISYKLYSWAESNGTVYINRIGGHDTTSNSYAVGCSTMTLMEIAA